jgi:hypothetical protein
MMQSRRIRLFTPQKSSKNTAKTQQRSSKHPLFPSHPSYPPIHPPPSDPKPNFSPQALDVEIELRNALRKKVCRMTKDSGVWYGCMNTGEGMSLAVVCWGLLHRDSADGEIPVSFFRIQECVFGIRFNHLLVVRLTPPKTGSCSFQGMFSRT